MAQKAVGTAAANTELSGYAKSAVKLLAGKDVPVLFNISNRKRGGDFTEIRKKRRIASFRQIAGILAGTDMTAEQYETFELGDTEDVLGAIDDALGAN